MPSLSPTLPASVARKNFYTILEEVGSKLRRFSITRRGRVQAVLMHPEEVAAWEETMDILADKKLVRDIARAKRERLAGQFISEKALLKHLGIKETDLK